ncbi:hypothetical protein EDB92DRAFT_1036242 [Lactarius akahatsu]|uniref:Uncharacterized protein n=1 Tax=Lactarius akahatsu TaxID=416441 RepID=A0AAD4Q9B3_9AGAM|nr:hypothetical protein EDB92DRAFT_1036242 [Lactarius akahatsu]
MHVMHAHTPTFCVPVRSPREPISPPPPLRAHAQHVWRGAVREIHRRCTVTMFVLAVSGCREASLEAVARPGGLDVVRGCTVDGKKYATHARTQTAREYHAQLAWHRRGSSNGQIDGRVIAFAKLGSQSLAETYCRFVTVDNGRKECVCISNVRGFCGVQSLLGFRHGSVKMDP